MKPILVIVLCCSTTCIFAQAPKTDTSIKPPIQLKPVHIIEYHFFRDSVAFREEYAREITFRRHKWYEVYQGLSLNIHNLYQVMQFKNNRKKVAFRKMLLAKEEEMYVTRNYTPSLVNKVTKLDGDSLQLFMRYYQPEYSFFKTASDYDIYLDIRQHYQEFLKKRDSLPGHP
ncbi:hypothetical protein [Chitinophaga sp. 212800010-3]|uniref:hypothetical protein n=1 Tax=unclassified Chitinophaga TaxID=2619133 RepID=UPI002E10F735